MIFCFSGTGNSLLVARHLARLLDDKIVALDPDEIVCEPLTADDIIVWVFPVHAWSVPTVVADYIMSIPEGVFRPDVAHFMVATCGDDVGHTDRVWRALMASRGWRDVGAYSVTMPNTYVVLPGFDVDSSDVEAAKLSAMPVRVGDIARRIGAMTVETDVKPGALPALKTRLLGPLFRRFLMSPAPFRVDSLRCSGCGRCAKLCPVHNITMVDNRPRWGSYCAMCLACYHGCPGRAVGYGRATRSKGQYRLPL